VLETSSPILSPDQGFIVGVMLGVVALGSNRFQNISLLVASAAFSLAPLPTLSQLPDARAPGLGSARPVFRRCGRSTLPLFRRCVRFPGLILEVLQFLGQLLLALKATGVVGSSNQAAPMSPVLVRAYLKKEIEYYILYIYIMPWDGIKSIHSCPKIVLKAHCRIGYITLYINRPRIQLR